MFSCRQTKWSTCTLSGQPLQPPLAADMLGSLYNKEAVLEFLLGRAGHFADEHAEVRAFWGLGKIKSNTLCIT